MKHLLRFIILFVVLTITATCEKENQSPVIQSTTASPQTIKTGETTQLTCVATDPDGDQLTYSWSSTNGTFPNGTNGSSVLWEAPDEAGTNTISVIVDDGKNVDDGSVGVTIEEIFDPLSEFIDLRDGNIYKWVEIGEQIWMAENLAYNVGDGCWVYSDEWRTLTTYGRLYTWEAAKAACPAGWHLPSDDEWKQLEMAIGMSHSEADDTYYRGINEGTKLKATNSWFENGNGTDDFGFSAIPGGFREYNFGYGDFITYGTQGCWWCDAEDASSTAWYRYLVWDYAYVGRQPTWKVYGLSVRCVKD